MNTEAMVDFRDELMEYYGTRLKDRWLLLRAVPCEIMTGVFSIATRQEITYAFACVPCGGDRLTGLTNVFQTRDKAEQVCKILRASGENFPMLRIQEYRYGFYVKWGLDEPSHKEFRGWDWEVAIAKQLGYNDECMVSHYQRYHRDKLKP
jgi:hypothetical protein